MNLEKLLKGKTVNVKTDVGVVVQLEIKHIKQHSEHHSEDLEPATQKNDWWPNSREWTTTWVDVTFTNGHTKKYNSLDEIELAEETA